MTDRIDQRMKMLSSGLEAAMEDLVRMGGIGVAAILEIPGGKDCRISAGHIDLEKSEPMDTGWLHVIASQTKMFTAASILLLAKESKLDLGDAVGKHLDNVPAVGEGATIAQMLNHTSGIGNCVRPLGMTLPYPWPQFSYDDLMALARTQGKRSEPGERLEYNNTDMMVLARICEVVSGMPRAEFLRRRIFEPLGMADTFVGATGEWPRERMAHGYYRPSQGWSGKAIDVSGLPDLSLAWAAGDLISTLDDMMIWSRALLSNDNDLGLTLADFAVDIAVADGPAVDWFAPRVCAYGLEGWFWAGRRVWGHRGSIFGYHSATFLEPLSGACISMFMTVETRDGLHRFSEDQGYAYMSLIQSLVEAAVFAVELP